MNLHGLVADAVGAVNPMTYVTIRASTGYTTNADGRQVPTYATAVRVKAQMQDLGTRDLQQIASLNIQSQTRKIYLWGNWSGLVRADRRGGDLVFADGKTWLVVQVAEAWPDWCAVIVAQQSP